MAERAKKTIICDCGRRFMVVDGEGHSVAFEAFEPKGYSAPAVFPECLADSDGEVLTVVCTCGIWHELREKDGRTEHERYFRAPANFDPETARAAADEAAKRAREAERGQGSAVAGKGTDTATPAATQGTPETAAEAPGRETAGAATRTATRAGGLLTRIARTREAQT